MSRVPVVTNYGTIIQSEYNLFGDDSLTNEEAFIGFTPGSTDLTATSDGTQPTPLADILELDTDQYGNTTARISDNGGPTPTVALVPGSPAIDAGAATCIATDQRDVTRPQGSACDIGANEAEPAPPGPFVQCPGDINGDGIADITVVMPDGNTWIKGLDGALVSQFTLSDIKTVVDIEIML